MANESFPPSSLPLGPLPPAPATSSKVGFQYNPLDKSIEEIRILILHPKRSDKPDEPIHCSLIHTTFRKRPIYEALSYVWGEQTVPYHGDVQVNGVSFVVGNNLGCALTQLRNKNNRNIWVDAICINQKDNKEKSLQIPLMPFIYQRAQKCLIWLKETEDSLMSEIRVLKKQAVQQTTEDDLISEMYTEKWQSVPQTIKDNFISEIKELKTESIFETMALEQIAPHTMEDLWMRNFHGSLPPLKVSSKKSKANNRAKAISIANAKVDTMFLKHVANNPYWHRVWIIQEIGSARRQEIIYGNCLTSWSDFIARLKEVEGLQDCIPIRLQGQLDDKYSNGYSLQHLIESHESSLCQEPRDHIYGFTSLANDAQRFPIDYSKSHFEVWKDIILFKCSKSADPQHDILSFGALIKKQLGVITVPEPKVVPDSASLLTAFSEARRELSSLVIPSDIQLRQTSGQIMVISRIIGSIAHVGPTCLDILAFPRRNIDWRTSINQHVQVSSKRPPVREESDLFLEQLESLEEESLEMAESYHGTLCWDQTLPTSKMIRVPANYSSFTPKKTTASSQLSPELVELLSVSQEHFIRPNGQRLFLLAEVKRFADGQTTPGCMGISPPGAREGDLICQIHGITRTVVVRKYKSYYRIIGTAVVSEDLQSARAMRDTQEKALPFQKAMFDTVEAEDRLDLYFDVARAYQLLD